jgi:hypothetical protein
MSDTEEKKRRARKPRRATRKPGGMPAYKPTEQERRFVTTMAGMGLRHDDICKVLGSGIRGRRGRMSKTCLH